VDVGATVSVRTIQTDRVSVTLSAGGAASGFVTFPAKYFVIPPVSLHLYSLLTPPGSLGVLQIKGNIGVTGFYWEINGGSAGAAVVFQWTAGS
jgi:hypothetical protein